MSQPADTIVLNGEAVAHDPGQSLADLLDRHRLSRPGIAVAVDGVVVRREDWSGTPVPAGATLDVLSPMQGG